jgi:hypothetical protein
MHIVGGVGCDDLHNYAVAVYCSVIAIIVAIISPVLGMLWNQIFGSQEAQCN